MCAFLCNALTVLAKHSEMYLEIPRTYFKPFSKMIKFEFSESFVIISWIRNTLVSISQRCLFLYFGMAKHV